MIPEQKFDVLVIVDLSGADLNLFDAYEAAVLPLVPEHGGEIKARVRGLDQRLECHLLSFPSEQAFDRFRADPRRKRAEPGRLECNAKFDVHIVRDVP